MPEKDARQASPERGPDLERPMLRPLEAFPVDNPADPRNPRLLALRDPSGLSPEIVTLPPMGAAIVGMLEGELDRDEICAAFQKQYGVPLQRASLDALIERLDGALMLDSPRMRAESTRIYREWNEAEERPALFAGRSYPSDPEALCAALEGHFAPPNGPGLPPLHAPRDQPLPRALIAPHVDFSRGGPAYAWAYRPLLLARELPDIVVLLGTNHNALDATFTFTRKRFATPLGTLATDLALLDEVLANAERLDDKLPQHLLYDEHQHRAEHALEFQAVWLAFVLRRRRAMGATSEKAPALLPLLCGSFHDFATGAEKDGRHDPMLRPNIPPFFQALGETLAAREGAGQRVMWLCSADLAHVGPRYGDREPLSKEDHDSLERRDKETLRQVLKGDAGAWLNEIRRERDRRRVCGLSPIYTLLRAARLEQGALRCYAQCQAEAGSVVSIASVLFP